MANPSATACRSRSPIAKLGRGRGYAVGERCSTTIGENIVSKSYRQIIRRFGPPLRSVTKPNQTLCVYYDTVGYQHGWSFCFRGQRIVSAAGNQPAPPGVH